MRTTRDTRRTTAAPPVWHAAAARTAVVVAVAVAALALPAAAQAAVAGISVRQPAPFVYSDGTLNVTAKARLTKAASRLRVRLRVLTTDGEVLYQETEYVRPARAGTNVVRFHRSLSEAGIPAGRHLMEVTARPGGGEESVAKDRLLVIPRSAKDLPVAVVVRFGYVPSRDSADRFVAEPALETTARAAVADMAELASVRPDLSVTLAPTPLMLDEWADIADGYDVASAGGIHRVEADAATPRAYRAALDGLRSAVASGAPLMRLPYADPDIAGLQSIGGLGELRSQLDLATDTLRSTLGANAATGTLLSGNSVPASATQWLEGTGVSHFLASPRTTFAGRAKAVPGVYGAVDSSASVLVVDERLSRVLSDPASTDNDLADALYERLTARGGPRPAVAVVTLGPGSTTDASHLRAQLATLARLEWVRLTDVSSLARGKRSGTVSLAPTISEGKKGAPAGYWTTLGSVRASVAALRRAAGASDKEARAATRRLAVATSAMWAGPDHDWALVDRGRAYASAAGGAADAILAKVGIAVPDVTLSGTRGKLPVSLVNGSGRELRVVLTSSSNDLRRPRSVTTPVTLVPGENIISLPVDLGSELSGRVNLRLSVDDVRLAETSAKVRASYIDRFALVGMVVVVLLALLWYIRRRMRAAAARGRGPADGGDAA